MIRFAFLKRTFWLLFGEQIGSVCVIIGGYQEGICKLRAKRSFYIYIKKKSIYLAVPGLSCSMWDVSLQHVVSSSLSRD